MKSSQNGEKRIVANEKITLEHCGSWPESIHVFDEDAALAVEMALATGRPLLVRGEPGSGKSQLARAAAHVLHRAFISEVITSAHDSQALLWHYDPVGRLYEAQTLAAEAAARAYQQEVEDEDSEEERIPVGIAALPTEGAAQKKLSRYRKKKSLQHKRQQLFKSLGLVAAQQGVARHIGEELHPASWISPGPLWWALDWASALRQHERCRCPFSYPPPRCARLLPEAAAQQGTVLLLDEIDKAEPSLPNTLLEVLGNGSFAVPLLGQIVSSPPSCPKPLVLITTNEERELPLAFVRRCLVLHLRLDDEPRLRRWWGKQAFRAEPFSMERALVKWLAERGEQHFAQIFTNKVRERAAELLLRDRREARQAGMIKPGQAEYLDLLRALHGMTAPGASEEQLVLLERISPFTFSKDRQE